MLDMIKPTRKMSDFSAGSTVEQLTFLAHMKKVFLNWLHN